MAAAPLPSIDLNKLVGRALQTPDLAPLFDLVTQTTEVTQQSIVAEIQPRLPDILSSTGDSLKLLWDAEGGLQHLAKERDSKLEELQEHPSAHQAQRNLLYGALGAAAIAGVAAVFSTMGPAPHRFSRISVALVTFAVLEFLVILQVIFSRRAAIQAYETASAAIKGNPDLAEATQQVQSLRNQFEETVYNSAILSEVRGILERARIPSYSTQLPPDVTDKGLSETTAGGHEIETEAKRELDELLKLTGGSIGLAGPRGSGKSTLINLVANRPLGNPPRVVCSVQCSAPVEYNGRDYIVTLFLLVCQWVQRNLLPKWALMSHYSTPDDRPAPIWAAALVSFLGRAAPVIAIVGALLIATALLNALLLMSLPQTPAAVPQPAATHAATGTPAAEQAGALSSTTSKRKDEPANTEERSKSDKPEAAPPQTGRWQRYALWTTEFLKSLGIQPVALLSWGAMFLTVSWTIAFFRPALALHMDPQLERGDRYGLMRFVGLGRHLVPREPPEYLADLKPEQRQLLDAATVHLESLRFQQSYTSGWSGALKLPFGVEGGMNQAQTMSRNQRSLPELVQTFREFLQVVTAQYGRVIIGIDELDKLQSDDKAHLFLNEIKAIFGVPNVFYIVSVSENAISAFERRGLPFRDVFDSSFDTIINVNFLKLDESKRLLKRRTTKIPEPFLCLCHCLSGGLPRDLIRSCREMLGVAAAEKLPDLLPLARSVITHEVHSKARAMSIAASKLRADGNQTKFLSSLTTLLTSDLNETSLTSQAQLLLGEADTLRNQGSNLPVAENGTLSEEAANLIALADLQAEFALYLAYVATVIETHALPQNDNDWIAAEKDKPGMTPNIFDALAATRQALAVSASVGRERLVSFRSTQGLAQTITVAPAVVVAAPVVAPATSQGT